jgi:hypothetical protein
LDKRVFNAASKKLSAVDMIGNIEGKVDARDEDPGEEFDENC